jgi:hypothetical protein
MTYPKRSRLIVPLPHLIVQSPRQPQHPTVAASFPESPQHQMIKHGTVSKIVSSNSATSDTHTSLTPRAPCYRSQLPKHIIPPQPKLYRLHTPPVQHARQSHRPSMLPPPPGSPSNPTTSLPPPHYPPEMIAIHPSNFRRHKRLLSRDIRDQEPPRPSKKNIPSKELDLYPISQDERPVPDRIQLRLFYPSVRLFARLKHRLNPPGRSALGLQSGKANSQHRPNARRAWRRLLPKRTFRRTEGGDQQ